MSCRLAALFAATTACLLLSACQTTAPAATAPAGNSRAANAEPSAPLAVSRPPPYYVRVQAEATGLVAVSDDGEQTFFEFAILPPADLKFFDLDGKPLRAVWVENFAAIAGVHRGVLIRLGTATSYVSLHPRAEQMRKPEVAETPIIAELRDRLLQEGPRTEMNRVLARLNATDTAPVQGHATMPELKSARSESPVSRSAIAATVGLTAAQVVAPAHASDPPETPWPRLQRVFFATNSVSISAPDDGLHKLLADARQSDEIWIAGHTDSIGPRTANTALARRRAEAIKYILTSRGVSPERIVLVRAPIDSYIADNETETGRARNRRVEVTFVKSGGLPAGPRALFGAPAAR